MGKRKWLTICFVGLVFFLSGGWDPDEFHASKKEAGKWEFIQQEGKMGSSEIVGNPEKEHKTERIRLSENEVKELEKINEDILEKREELIEKYVEFGILSEDRAERMKAHLDDHFRQMKERQFLPFRIFPKGRENRGLGETDHGS